MRNGSISSVGTYFTTIRMATMIATRTDAITISAHIPKVHTQSENATKCNQLPHIWQQPQWFGTYSQLQILSQTSTQHSVQHTQQSRHTVFWLLFWAALVAFADSTFWFILLFANCGWVCIGSKSVVDDESSSKLINFHMHKIFILFFNYKWKNINIIFSPWTFLSTFTAHIFTLHTRKQNEKTTEVQTNQSLTPNNRVGKKEPILRSHKLILFQKYKNKSKTTNNNTHTPIFRRKSGISGCVCLDCQQVVLFLHTHTQWFISLYVLANLDRIHTNVHILVFAHLLKLGGTKNQRNIWSLWHTVSNWSTHVCVRVYVRVSCVCIYFACVFVYFCVHIYFGCEPRCVWSHRFQAEINNKNVRLCLWFIVIAGNSWTCNLILIFVHFFSLHV